MATNTISREEKLGLGLAALGHIALVWMLVAYKPGAPPPPPERVSVTLSDELGAVSTAPDPTANPAPDQGPALGEPAPEQMAVPQPEPIPTTTAPAMAAPKVAAKIPAKPPQQPQKTSTRTPPAQAGASSFDNLFGKGIPGGNGKDKTPAASKASAQQVASWDSSIKSKVLRQWNSCPVNGLDIAMLRATVRFTLDRNGGILSIEEPVVTGITEANRTQARPFRDCAIRAIKLAAPFTGMPVEFYDEWKPRRLNFTK